MIRLAWHRSSPLDQSAFSKRMRWYKTTKFPKGDLWARCGEFPGEMREGFWTENSIRAHRAQLLPTPCDRSLLYSMSIILICQTVWTAVPRLCHTERKVLSSVRFVCKQPVWWRLPPQEPGDAGRSSECLSVEMECPRLFQWPPFLSFRHPIKAWVLDL